MLEEIKPSIITIVENTNYTHSEKLQQICNLLQTKIDYYNWVGFYFANAEKQELHLGEYAGAHTDHLVIPFGKGICGQVALTNKNFVVPDVSAQSNYIACSATVKSEIVVPIFVNNSNIGQIDIDSHTLNAFSPTDERFLEWLTTYIAKLY